MRPGQLVVTVEHCHSCAAAHGMSTKHDAAKYLRVAEAVATAARAVCTEVLGAEAVCETETEAGARVRAVLVPADIRPARKCCRVGALEVQVAVLDETGAARIAVLHSKLASGFWPTQDKVARRLRRFLKAGL